MKVVEASVKLKKKKSLSIWLLFDVSSESGKTASSIFVPVQLRRIISKVFRGK